MAYSGVFKPVHPEKYKGDSHNIVYRSLWEQKLMRRFDTSPDIKWWASEECIVPYVMKTYDKRSKEWAWTHHRYFPDFVVCRVLNGKEDIIMVEVKPFKETHKPVHKKGKRKASIIKEELTFAKNTAKWEAAERFCAKNGWKFQILTEKEIGHTGRG
jgi:hypothetical protein